MSTLRVFHLIVFIGICFISGAPPISEAESQSVTSNQMKAAQQLDMAASKGDISAIQLLFKEAMSGNPAAQLYYGHYCANVMNDRVQSADWIQRAATQGFAVAQNELGALYVNGEGKPQDYAEAILWFHKAAAQGNAMAQSNLGGLYATGKGVTQNYSEAVNWYQKAAEQGDAVSQNELGVLYAKGLGTPQDYTEAALWFRKAAEQGSSVSQCNLGGLYATGKGVPKDYTEAALWFRKAAEQGYSKAQIVLGDAYAMGRGVSQDYTEAAYWLHKAAEQGDQNAKNSLTALNAIMGKKEPDKTVNPTSGANTSLTGSDKSEIDQLLNGAFDSNNKSLNDLIGLANSGNSYAQVSLGVYYFKGININGFLLEKPNFPEAFKWIKKSADQGDSLGEYWMGVCYELGMGDVLSVDYNKSIVWLNKSSSQGNKNAKDLLTTVEKYRDIVESKSYPSNINDAEIKFSASNGEKIIKSPKIKADDKMYVISGIIKYAEKDAADFIGVPSGNPSDNPIAQAFSAQYGVPLEDTSGYFFKVEIPKSLQQNYYNEARIGGGFNLIGKYIDNTTIELVTGESKTIPVFEAEYFDATNQN